MDECKDCAPIGPVLYLHASMQVYNDLTYSLSVCAYVYTNVQDSLIAVIPLIIFHIQPLAMRNNPALAHLSC